MFRTHPGKLNQYALTKTGCNHHSGKAATDAGPASRIETRSAFGPARE